MGNKDNKKKKNKLLRKRQLTLRLANARMRKRAKQTRDATNTLYARRSKERMAQESQSESQDINAENLAGDHKNKIEIDDDKSTAQQTHIEIEFIEHDIPADVDLSAKATGSFDEDWADIDTDVKPTPSQEPAASPVNANDDATVNTLPAEEPWVVTKSLCRCCHAEGDFDPMSAADGDEPPPTDMLLHVFDIQLCPTAEPGAALRSVCMLCRARLRDAHQFLEQVRACDEHFTWMYSNGRIKVPDVEIETTEVKDDAADGIEITEVKDEAADAPKAKPPLYRLTKSDYKRIGSLLQCVRCDQRFSTAREVGTHVKFDHLKLLKYKCPECTEQFRTLAPYIEHKLESHGIDDRIKCNACPRTFTKHSQLVKHTNSFHKLGTRIVCELCDYECYSYDSLKRHKFRHKTVKEYHCKFCNKAFMRDTTVRLHERIHTGDRRKVCDQCGKAFVQKASLNYHMAKYHPEVKY